MPDFSLLIAHWYRLNNRKLPWRDSNNPYFIWLSEVILQQTRVDQGLNYYKRFILEFPTVRDLARASERDVLRLWQGLGYYSRARNLHKAAKMIVRDHKATFPDKYGELIKLPGIGPYSAAAIASIAFGEHVAAIDGNVIRVVSRIFEISAPIGTAQNKSVTEQAAKRLLHPTDAGTHNQAMMELGALICTPKNPSCNICPVQLKCGAFANGRPEAFPIKKKNPKVRHRYFNYAVRTDGVSVIIRKRTKRDIWKGLYEFPMIESEIEITSKMHLAGPLEVLDGLVREFRVVHLLSHQRLYVSFWFEKVGSIKAAAGERIIKIGQIRAYPVPQVLVRYIEQSGHFQVKALSLKGRHKKHVVKRK